MGPINACLVGAGGAGRALENQCPHSLRVLACSAKHNIIQIRESIPWLPLLGEYNWIHNIIQIIESMPSLPVLGEQSLFEVVKSFHHLAPLLIAGSTTGGVPPFSAKKFLLTFRPAEVR